MTTLRIVRWSVQYEVAQSRRSPRSMSWFPMPNKLDGDGYTELVEHEDGAAHYGAWCAILCVASKCKARGVLRRDNGAPHDSRSLSRITRLPEKTVSAALDRLIEIGWIERTHTDDGEHSEPTPNAVGEQSEHDDTTGQDKHDRQDTAPPAHIATDDESLKATADRVPYDAIVEAYNVAVDGTRWAKCSKTTDALRKALRARWDDAGRSIDTMRDLFAVLKSNAFLRDSKSGDVSIRWALGSENFADIIVGKYRPDVPDDAGENWMIRAARARSEGASS